jgi:uncharacterized membrane protein YgaE (UPF0421/DUF939 family)
MIYSKVIGHSAVMSGIAAIVCLKPTTSETTRAMTMRLLSTVIGGLLGMSAAYIGFIFPLYQQGLKILIVPAIILLCIYICNIIEQKDTVILACAVLLIIALKHEEGMMSQKEIFLYTFWRIVDTATGAIIAMGVNKFIWNNKPLVVTGTQDYDQAPEASDHH